MTRSFLNIIRSQLLLLRNHPWEPISLPINTASNPLQDFTLSIEWLLYQIKPKPTQQWQHPHTLLPSRTIMRRICPFALLHRGVRHRDSMRYQFVNQCRSLHWNGAWQMKRTPIFQALAARAIRISHWPLDWNHAHPSIVQRQRSRRAVPGRMRYTQCPEVHLEKPYTPWHDQHPTNILWVAAVNQGHHCQDGRRFILGPHDVYYEGWGSEYLPAHLRGCVKPYMYICFTLIWQMITSMLVIVLRCISFKYYNL